MAGVVIPKRNKFNCYFLRFSKDARSKTKSINKQSLVFQFYNSRIFPDGQNFPRINSLSGCALLKEAGMLFFFAFLKVSICFLLLVTIS